MVLNENGSSESAGSSWWAVIIFFVVDKHNISCFGHVFFWESLDVDTNVVSWSGFIDGLVMHFNGESFTANTSWGESNTVFGNNLPCSICPVITSPTPLIL